MLATTASIDADPTDLRSMPNTFSQRLGRMGLKSIRNLATEQHGDLKKKRGLVKLMSGVVVFLALAAAAAVTAAFYLGDKLLSPATNNVDMYNGTLIFSRSQLASRTYWSMLAYANEWEIYEFTFAITMGNESGIDEILRSVSHPESQQYSQHMSYDDVQAMASNWEGTRAVVHWLKNDVHAEITNIHTHGRYVTARANVYLMGVATGTPTTFWDIQTGQTMNDFGEGLEEWIKQVSK